MNPFLIIVLLSHEGYWIAGTEGVVRVRSALANPEKVGVPASDFAWELTLDGVRVAEGKTPLDGGGGETRIKMVCPDVRTRVPLRLSWRMIARDGGRELAAGAAAIDAFPADLAARWAGIVGNRHLVIVDPEGGLSKQLAAAHVPHARVRETSELQLQRAAIVLVAPDALAGGLFEQSPLVALARSGAGVMVLRQTRVKAVAGLPLARRTKPRRLVWDENHPLLQPFTEHDFTRWLDGWPADLPAVRLPAGMPANSLVKWPAEAQGGASPAGTTPAASPRIPADWVTPGGARLPVDALLVVQPVGRGRLVVCQLPLGDWETDPRSQLFLGTALDYLTTRPEPVSDSTPPALPLTNEAAGRPLPVVPISPGDRP